MPKPKAPASRFILEIFSIFLGVTIAFLANHWNEQRKERILEDKMLNGIYNELEADVRDIQLNINGHEQGLVAIKLFQRYCESEPVDFDSLGLYFKRLYRDYISIANTSTYETLKSRGLQIISNDQLRSRIVELYDFNYEITQKLEEGYFPSQFHQNYFGEIASHFKNHIELEGSNVRIVKPYGKSPDPEMMLILSEIFDWRQFSIQAYQQNLDVIKTLREDLKAELD